MTQSLPDPADDLTLALAEMLRTALTAFPELVPDPDRLVARLAPALSVRLAEASVAAGGTAGRLARALAAGSRAPGADAIEARVLAALNRHPGGRAPGVTPESLATLTGLPPGELGAAVSALIQAGHLVRDGWLVRLPHADDLLSIGRPLDREGGDEQRLAAERRAIGDRRAVGERRLYDRRTPP